jgi:hypothetical protein
VIGRLTAWRRGYWCCASGGADTCDNSGDAVKAIGGDGKNGRILQMTKGR